MEVLDRPQSAVAEYQPFYAQLAELEEKNTALVFDYESKKGNKEARSHVNTLRLTKGALERTRKAAKEESLRKGRAVDSEAKEIERRIEAMITVHQAEIDKIEKREADRIDAIQVKLGELYRVHEGMTAADYRFHIATLEAVVIDDKWQEFVADAARGKDASIAKHRELLAAREKQDAEAAELERLRAEAAARAQKDRDDAIAKAAAERARAEAQAEAERAAKAAAQAAADAEAKAKAEREAGERRELELQLAAENAERRRVEAEQKAAQEAIDAAAKAEKNRLQAIQDEKDRAAAAEAAEVAAAAKREANKAHKAKINRTAVAALVADGVSEECAKQCVTLIAQGKVPAVAIAY